MRKYILSLILLLAGSGWATGDDWGFYYQAQIQAENGDVIRDSYNQIIHEHRVVLNLYTGTSNSDPSLWAGTFDVYCDDSGLFNVFVADSTSTEKPATTLENVFMDHAAKVLYIGLTVKTAPYAGEIRPRQRLGAVPYAAYANAACVLAGNPATIPGNLKVSGVLTCHGGLEAASVSVAGSLNVVEDIKIGTNIVEGVPVGGILMWNRDDPPTGTWDGDGKSSDGRWQKCNGENGSPDLQGRFPIGVSGSYSLNASGGEANVTLTANQIPKHFHRRLADDSYERRLRTINWADNYGDPKKVGRVFDKDNRYKTWDVSDSGGYPENWVTPGDSNEGHADVVETGAAGGKEDKYGAATEPHENMPPYYALYYIMRIN